MSEEKIVAEAAPETNEPEVNPAVEAENMGLKKLGNEELINIIHETRSEAKSRRLKAKELEEKIAEIESQKKLEEQKNLEQNNEFKTLYEQTKEETKDYEDLKEFKMSYLNTCKDKIESIKNGLTKAETELFELSSKSMPYDEQLTFIEKLVGNRTTAAIIDKTQSTARSNNDDSGQINKPVPFGSGSLSNNIMNGLAALRKK